MKQSSGRGLRVEVEPIELDGRRRAAAVGDEDIDQRTVVVPELPVTRRGEQPLAQPPPRDP